MIFYLCLSWFVGCVLSTIAVLTGDEPKNIRGTFGLVLLWPLWLLKQFILTLFAGFKALFRGL